MQALKNPCACTHTRVSTRAHTHTHTHTHTHVCAHVRRRKLDMLADLLGLGPTEAQALARRCPMLLTCAPTSMTAKVDALQRLTGLPPQQVRCRAHAQACRFGVGGGAQVLWAAHWHAGLGAWGWVRLYYLRLTSLPSHLPAPVPALGP